MKKVAGIRFKHAGKVYDFDSGAFVLHRGDHVIVETEQGLSMGMVVVPPIPYDESDARRSAKPLKKVFRRANADDFLQIEKNTETEKKRIILKNLCINYYRRKKKRIIIA